jgi:hypothetical protein
MSNDWQWRHLINECCKENEKFIQDRRRIEIQRRIDEWKSQLKQLDEDGQK